MSDAKPGTHRQVMTPPVNAEPMPVIKSPSGGDKMPVVGNPATEIKGPFGTNMKFEPR